MHHTPHATPIPLFNHPTLRPPPLYPVEATQGIRHDTINDPFQGFL